MDHSALNTLRDWHTNLLDRHRKGVHVLHLPSLISNASWNWERSHTTSIDSCRCQSYPVKPSSCCTHPSVCLCLSFRSFDLYCLEPISSEHLESSCLMVSLGRRVVMHAITSICLVPLMLALRNGALVLLHLEGGTTEVLFYCCYLV